MIVSGASRFVVLVDFASIDRQTGDVVVIGCVCRRVGHCAAVVTF